MIPYHSRIMACLPGHTPTEIVRFNHPMTPKEWSSWVGPMSRDWELWAEWRTPDRHTVSERVYISRKGNPKTNGEVELTVEGPCVVVIK